MEVGPNVRGTQMPQMSTVQVKAAVACGVLAVLSAIGMYWIVVPAVVFGVAAIALGWRARKDGPSELGSVAIALGLVGILLVPAVLLVVDEAEDWGRECALEPTKAHC